MLGVTSAGNLLGTITAGHDIGGGMSGGGIRSYGQINANISALNSSGVANGGAISSVIANGDISGTITAVGALGSVTSGANLFATVSAGTLGLLTAWDSSTAGTTAPVAPASIVPDLLNAVGTARAFVVLDRTNAYNDFLALTSDVAMAGSNAAGDIATAQSTVVMQTATAVSDSANQLSNAQTAATSQFTSSSTTALANAQSTLDSANARESTFKAELSQSTKAGEGRRRQERGQKAGKKAGKGSEGRKEGRKGVRTL